MFDECCACARLGQKATKFGIMPEFMYKISIYDFGHYAQKTAKIFMKCIDKENLGCYNLSNKQIFIQWRKI